MYTVEHNTLYLDLNKNFTFLNTGDILERLKNKTKDYYNIYINFNKHYEIDGSGIGALIRLQQIHKNTLNIYLENLPCYLKLVIDSFNLNNFLRRE